MSMGTDWGELIDTTRLRSVWRGSLHVVDSPQTMMWWQAWTGLVPGVMNLLHVGVTTHVSGSDLDECFEVAHRLLGGIVTMTWKAVGRSLSWSVRPVRFTALQRGDAYMGRVVVEAADGRSFEPLMMAIQETKTRVEEA